MIIIIIEWGLSFIRYHQKNVSGQPLPCMKQFYVITFVLSLFLCVVARAQAPALLQLKNGRIDDRKNLQHERLGPQTLTAIHFGNHYYTVLRFDALPDAATKNRLSMEGILLSDYIPGNAFMAELSDHTDLRDLQRFRVSGAYSLDPALKISPSLTQNGEGSKTDAGTLIAVNYFGSMTREEVIAALRSAGATPVYVKLQPEHTIFVQASAAAIRKMALLPFVAYIAPQVIRATALNYFTQGGSSVSALNMPAGRNLHGRNVAVGVGDNGDPTSHIDFAGRVINRNPEPYAVHGTHVTGTVGGAGLLNEKWAGMAPQSTLISQYFTDILFNAPVYTHDYGMVLTNNSYHAAVPGCPGDGEYDNLSNYVDAQMNRDSTLLHVFAVGNDGAYTCSPYPAFFGTVKSGFQCSKNPIEVGAIDNITYLPLKSTSRGPAKDGRLKPEVVAGGVNVFSTTPFNDYGGDWGSSMAAPAVAGSLALLYERYRQLHGGTNPSAALMKAIVCNGADDIGNPGPDYLNGFGKLNARRSVEMIEKNQFVTGNMNNGNAATFTINGVPAGTYQLRVMLYWQDVAAAAYAGAALVNDLDLTVASPDATVHQPLVLDPTPANVTNNAREGVDNLNNIEQVVITNPPAGSFTVTVKGTRIPSGPQKYVVVYELMPAAVTMEYPYGGEKWVSGEQQFIRWNAGGSPGPFAVEYSTDNGISWTKITDTTGNICVWNPPAITAPAALVRVTDKTTGASDISKASFTIMEQPALSVSNPCLGYAQLSWNATTAATGYEVMMLQGDSMRTIATTTATSYLAGGLNKDSIYWFSVRPLISTARGRRSLAKSVFPNGGACTLAAFNNDMASFAIIAPPSGRMYTLSQLGNQPIQMNIQNLGSVATGPFNISYQVNGGAIITETNTSGMAASSSITYTFATPFNFSAVGYYAIKAWVDYAADPQHANDTATTVVKQLGNDPLVLNYSFTEGFESAAASEYVKPVMGLTGLDRCDFNTLSTRARLRTFVNTGIARTGNRCITLDQFGHSYASSADSATLTFNLSNYSSGDQLWLDFYYRNHGNDIPRPGNAVWVRGSEQSAWIRVFNFPTNVDFSIYSLAPPVNITNLLAAASPAQTVSSTFQVRFGQEAYTSTNSVIPDGSEDDGISIDDVTLTRALNDAAVMGITAPDSNSNCGLGTTEPVSIIVKNYSNTTLSNIPVSYSVNGSTVTESISSLAPGQQVTYKFSKTADLSAYQAYNLTCWVSYPTDNYHRNDTAMLHFITTPLISTYPYLEGFEANNGYWYASGINSSWAWGVPAKSVIKGAANGRHAWVTNLTGPYNNNEYSFLYSPCFDLSGLAQPVLSFSHIFRTEDNCDCDYHWVEYTEDNITWKRLGSAGNGVHWYDNVINQAWQKSDTAWHVTSIDLPVRSGKVRFRFVMWSDPAVNYDGVGIDDIHVFDKTAIYTGPNITAGLVQPVSGNNWVNFDMGGRRVASIHPRGQDLGATEIKMFNNNGAVRFSSPLYYLDRNLVIRPGNTPTGDVSVRYYFTDSEFVKMAAATGCTSCTRVKTAYNAGVTQYSDAPAEENGILTDDTSGHFYYMTPRTDISMIPYDNGYYAEFRTSHFSEFWINSGGPAQNTPAPANLQSFVASRQGAGALLQWKTLVEVNTQKFVVEKSFNATDFTAVGEVPASGNSNTVNTYQLTDNNLYKGINYYRLRIVRADGSYQYSPVVLLDASDNELLITIYPNPASAVLNVLTSSSCTRIDIADILGRTLRSVPAAGYKQTISLNGIVPGTYFLTITTAAGRRIEKLVVE